MMNAIDWCSVLGSLGIESDFAVRRAWGVGVRTYCRVI